MEQPLDEEAFWRPAEVFHQSAAALGHPDIRNYCWYQTIALPGGVITPGQYHFRETLAMFGFLRDMMDGQRKPQTHRHAA